MLFSCNDMLDLDARWNPDVEPELTRVESELVLYGTFHEKCWEKWEFLSNKPDLCQSQSRLVFMFVQHVAQTFSFLMHFNKRALIGLVLYLQNLKKKSNSAHF